MTIAANDEGVFSLTMKELQAVADKLNGKVGVRFNPDDQWTAEDELLFRNRVNAELALLKAEQGIPHE